MDVVKRLRSVAGRGAVLVGEPQTRRFRQGFRFGRGDCVAVVQPRSLVEMWRTLQVCVDAGCVVIIQAANTGLTGGSTPDGAGDDRPVVIISVLRLGGVQVIDGGRQVVCLPGATLHRLEADLRPYDREPHSVIGASCLGASVIGGVCNNSGGALVRRGPAYTEMALYARLDETGDLVLVNHLGIDLGDTPEAILARLERGAYSRADISPSGDRRASDDRYATHVRQVDADTPARFNADASRLFEASGSAGKVAVFAVRLDTFPAEKDAKVFYIGSNATSELAALRRDILMSFSALPIAAEYIHRDAYDLAADYGKDTFLAIKLLGAARLPALFRGKAWIDRVARRLPGAPSALSDRLLQAAARLAPNHLPKRMAQFRDRFEHHLLLKVAGEDVAETRRRLAATLPSASGDVFECTDEEAQAAFLHRFAVAGAAVRYHAIHEAEVGDIVALDIALRRNDPDWFEVLPPEMDRQLVKKLYYGHFLCHVLHQDYIAQKGADALALEHAMWRRLDARGAAYPAEHNVGHLYPAAAELAAHYRGLDPCNQFNPGIGQTSKRAFWCEPA